MSFSTKITDSVDGITEYTYVSTAAKANATAIHP